jgi:hypothetical protein
VASGKGAVVVAMVYVLSLRSCKVYEEEAKGMRMAIVGAEDFTRDFSQDTASSQEKSKAGR